MYVKLCFTVQTLSPSWSILQMFHILHVNLPSPRECPENVPHPHKTSPLHGTSILFRVRCIFSDWTDTQQSSAIYVLGASYKLVYAAWFGVSVSERSQGSTLVKTAGLPIGSPFSSSSSSFSRIPPHGSLASVHWLGASICIWLFYLIVGPLRGQSC